jgi:hypothetical protein
MAKAKSSNPAVKYDFSFIKAISPLCRGMQRTTRGVLDCGIILSIRNLPLFSIGIFADFAIHWNYLVFVSRARQVP